MATHFVKILSRFRWVSVPEPARTLFSGRHTVQVWAAGGGRGSRATPTPLGFTNPHAHTQDHYPALQGEHLALVCIQADPPFPMQDLFV